MKIVSLQENLKSGLYYVGHIAGKNVNLPILNNVMIEARDGNIKFITTDLEIGVVATVRGKVEVNGVYTVDAKIMTEFISLLPNQKIEIEQKDNKLKIKSDNYKTTIKGQPADDFPLIPQIDKKHHYKIGIGEFKKGLSQVVFAVSTAETRIELTGVLFHIKDNILTLAATDSYRLAEKRLNIITDDSEERRLIVPAKTIQELNRILSAAKGGELEGDKGEIEIYISENQIQFGIGSIELISRLIEGQYPDYAQIIPNRSETTVKINKDELVRAVKAAALFSKTGINDISLDFPTGKNRVVITSASSQIGENTTNLTAEVQGKDNGIVVNFRYLLDGISNIDTDDLKLGVIDGNTPCLLGPNSGEDYRYVIMPIKQ